MRGELLGVGWVSGSTLLQGTSVMMSVFIFNGTSGRDKFNKVNAQIVQNGHGVFLQASSWAPGLVSSQYLISIEWIWRAGVVLFPMLRGTWCEGGVGGLF
eukprot:1159309-Pelagomonas_calceolata.AAC.5